MNISPINQANLKPQKTYKQSFGMCINLDKSALVLAEKMGLTKQFLEPKMPEILAMATKNGKEIFTDGRGVGDSIIFDSTAEGKKLSGIVFSLERAKNTFDIGSWQDSIASLFKPTLHEIQKGLDVQISDNATAVIKTREDKLFLKNTFGGENDLLAE